MRVEWWSARGPLVFEVALMEFRERDRQQQIAVLIAYLERPAVDIDIPRTELRDHLADGNQRDIVRGLKAREHVAFRVLHKAAVLTTMKEVSFHDRLRRICNFVRYRTIINKFIRYG